MQSYRSLYCTSRSLAKSCCAWRKGFWLRHGPDVRAVAPPYVLNRLWNRKDIASRLYAKLDLSRFPKQVWLWSRLRRNMPKDAKRQHLFQEMSQEETWHGRILEPTRPDSLGHRVMIVRIARQELDCFEELTNDHQLHIWINVDTLGSTMLV